MITKLRLIHFAAFLALSFYPDATRSADCNTELKVTDGYKELSAKLKCLSGEVEALRREVHALSGTTATGRKAAPLPASKPVALAKTGHISIEVRQCARASASLFLRHCSDGYWQGRPLLDSGRRGVRQSWSPV